MLGCSATKEEEEEGNDSHAFAFFVALCYNAVPQEEEGDESCRRLLRCVARQCNKTRRRRRWQQHMLPSPSFLRVLALERKGKKKSDNNVAAIAFFVTLHCSATKEEQEEGDGSVVAVTSFFTRSCAAEKRKTRRRRQHCYHRLLGYVVAQRSKTTRRRRRRLHMLLSPSFLRVFAL